MTNFLAVKSRNGQLPDLLPRKDQLDNNLRIKMKVVAVQLEGDFRQGLGGIEPVSAVELAEIGPQK
jgi:hypothetical protein